MPKIVKNALNPKTLESLTDPGKYNDGAGLVLRIDKQGNKVWIQRVTLDGRETSRGLGKYPAVSLAEARKAAAELKQRLASEPKPEPDVLTFAEASERFLEGWLKGSRRQRNGGEWRWSLRAHVYPTLGHLPVDEITTADVLSVLTSMWVKVPVTAKRVRQRMEKIFDWAILHNYRERANPAGKYITAVLPKVRRAPEHHKALPHAEVPQALRKIELSNATPIARLCFRFLVLTATRSGEARGADWSEVDLDTATWVIPAARMKSERLHRIPLSNQALDVLYDARELALTSDRGPLADTPRGEWPSEGLIFPTDRGQVMYSGAFSETMRKLKLDAVPHGFRGSFRNWCAERGLTRDLAEASLAHVLGENQAETAYLQTDLLEQRRPVMQEWADLCTGRPAVAKGHGESTD